MIGITTIIASILNLVLGFIVFRKAKTNATNIVIFLMALCLSAWSISLLLSDTVPTTGQSLLWTRMSFFFSVWAVYFFTFLSFIFPYEKIRFNTKIVFGLTAVIIFSAISFTKLFVANVELQDWGYNTELGPLASVIAIYLLFFCGLGIIKLFVKLKRSSGIERQQLFYVFIGLFLTVLLALLFAVVIPLLTDSAEYAKIAPLSTLFLIAFTSYAIVRHRLMDIRLIVKRTSVYVSTIVLILLFALGLYWLEMSFFKEIIPPGVWGPIVLLLGLIAFEPLKNYLERIANKYFFASLYNYQATLEKLAKELTHSIDLDEIINSIVKTIRDTMKLDRTGILLFDEESHNYQVKNTIGFSVQNGISLVRNNFLTNYLLEKRKPVIYQELESLSNNGHGEKSEIGKLKANMKRIEASLCLPLIIKNKLIGIIVLGEKISRDAYTKEDLNLLDSLSNQASIALENARLYQQVQDFTTNFFSRRHTNRWAFAA